MVIANHPGFVCLNFVCSIARAANRPSDHALMKPKPPMAETNVHCSTSDTIDSDALDCT